MSLVINEPVDDYRILDALREGIDSGKKVAEIADGLGMTAQAFSGRVGKMRKAVAKLGVVIPRLQVGRRDDFDAVAEHAKGIIAELEQLEQL